MNELPSAQAGDLGGAADIGSGLEHPLPKASAAQSQYLELLDWKLTREGALIGFAEIGLSCGLKLPNCPVFQKNGRALASLPSEMMRDRNGVPLLGSDGKARYRQSAFWRSRDLQGWLSTAVVALVRKAHPGDLDGDAR